MKDLIDIFVKDCRKEGFTRREWMMGGVAVAVIMAVCLFAEFINQL